MAALGLDLGKLSGGSAQDCSESSICIEVFGALLKSAKYAARARLALEMFKKEVSGALLKDDAARARLALEMLNKAVFGTLLEDEVGKTVASARFHIKIAKI